MTFAEWLKGKPRGTLAEVSRDIRVLYPTLHAISQGRPTRGRLAKLISEYTGGVVTIEELVCPPPRVAPSEANSESSR